MNLLSQETSPYLLSHKDHPVHWKPWGDAALSEAREQNKPVLLSIGYASCHWCHVMSHESFEDAAMADIMNTHFVCIKVDREERPDLDQIYQTALALIGRQGGWPLTMFLTPDGKPFWGGTYFPKLPRQGLPSFKEVLRGVADSWEKEQDRITHNTTNVMQALEQINKAAQGNVVSREQTDQICTFLVNRMDPVHGGFAGTGAKFPSVPVFQLLWQSYLRTGDERYKYAVLTTLTNMCQGGLYDHLGGGFYRYTVDAEWLVPHFEKMLYDNALITELLVSVWQETGNPLFKRRIEETIDFLLREMRITGGFAGSFDADSEGVEGKYYVWTVDEIKQVLGEDAALFAQFYDVVPEGNWEDGVNILNRLQSLSEPEDDIQEKLATCREKLLAVRQKRIAPARDDKILTDWNGLCIKMLVQAGFALNRQDWIKAAEDVYQDLVQTVGDDKGHLAHSFCDGKQVAGVLDDYAAVTLAELMLYQVTQKPVYLAQAEKRVRIAKEIFEDSDQGGFFMTPATEKLIIRPKTANDQAIPAANALMADVCTRLYYLTGKDDYYQTAEKTLKAFTGELAHNFFPLCSLIAVSDFLQNGVQFVICGQGEGVESFKEVLRQYTCMPHVMQVISDNTDLPEGHPAKHKKAKSGACLYICQGMRCLPPVQAADDVAEALQEAIQGQYKPAANDDV